MNALVQQAHPEACAECAADLASRIAPWDSDADVKRIAAEYGLPSDDATIAAARKLLRDNHVKNEHGLPGWGDGE